MKKLLLQKCYFLKSCTKLLLLITCLSLPGLTVLGYPKSITTFSNTIAKKQRLIKGVVKDSEGLLMPGVSVLEKGTKNGAITDENGAFAINTTGQNPVLIFSSIGYITKEVSATTAILNVMLEADKKSLDEIIVVGYGTQKKANLTGAVSQIDSKMLENRPTANLGQALQGLMPNLNVNISNGSPNTSATFNVRGGTSFYKDANDGNKIKFDAGSPFTLVDGIEMDPSQLNPEDIESVTLLKDAASAAIYGARGAFGVLLIKTKSGKGSKAKVTYSNSFQFSKPTAVPNLLDAYTIQDAIIKGADMENGSNSDQKFILSKIKEYMDDPEHVEPYYFNAGNPNTIVWRANVNPYNEALLKTSPMQKHNLSVSGAGENVSYYGSLGYLDQDGLFKINTDNFKRYNALLNVSSKINNWFKVDFRTSFNSSVYQEPVNPGGKGGWWAAMSQEPARNVYMPIRVPASLGLKQIYTDNILSFMDYGSSNREKENSTLLAVAPTVNLTKSWNLRGDFSFLTNNNVNKTIVPRLERIENNKTSYTAVYTDPDYISRYNYNSNKYTINVYTDYSKTIANKHNFYGLLGYNREWLVDQGVTSSRNNINNNVPTLGQAQGVQTVSDSESHWAVSGLFYRFTYNYDGKYLIESNGRYDGTSKFPAGLRYKFFPSFSAGWRVTEENFAKGIKPYINDFKLRGSYGSLGNQNVRNYLYILNYGTTSQIQYLLNGLRPVGISAPGLVNPDITWETATTIDFGFDLVAFKNFEVNFDWYRRRTTDILTDGIAYPAVLGSASPTLNTGTLDTKGWELILKYKNKTRYNLNYDFALTVGDYQTKVVKFDNNPANTLSDATLYNGQTMGEIWGYETLGLFQSREEINNSPQQLRTVKTTWFPGDVKYKDINGDGEVNNGTSTLNNSGDRRIIGNSTPRYQFGINANFSYQNFDLNFFFQGVGKRDLWIGNNLYWGAGTIGTWETYNNSWTPTNTDAYFPGYKNAARNREVQTRYLENGAYIRLKNLAIGYSIPKTLTDKIKLQRIRISASAFNLFEIKSVPKTFDPELVSMNYPIQRSFAFGVQVTL